MAMAKEQDTVNLIFMALIIKMPIFLKCPASTLRRPNKYLMASSPDKYYRLEQASEQALRSSTNSTKLYF